MKQRGRRSAAALAIGPPQPAPQPLAREAKAPAHLSKDARAWWRAVTSEYLLEPHHLRLLQAAAEAWDRAQGARQEVAAYGSLTITDSNGNMRAHPLIAVERDSRTLFARLVRELDLDAEGPAERARLPAILSNRQGR